MIQKELDLLISIGFTEREQIAIQKLSEMQQLTPLQILRQALRLYQAESLGTIKCESTKPGLKALK